MRVKVKAWGDGRRRRALKDAERKRKTERAAKRASKAPAVEGDHVYEIAKKQALYVARVVAPAHAKDAGVIGMSYRLDGTEAVCSTWADFRRFFKVIEDGQCEKCEKPVGVEQFCFGCGELICEGCGEAPMGRHRLDQHTLPCRTCGERVEAEGDDHCPRCSGEEDE